MLYGVADYQDPEAEAKRVGHIMGIKGNAALKYDQLQTFVAKTEANFDYISIKYVQEKLNLYNPPAAEKEQWSQIRNMFNHTGREINQIRSASYSQLGNQQQKRYLANEPVHLVSGWKGHSIGVTFYKGYLIVSNRGEGGTQNEGTSIYKLSRQPTPADFIAIQKTLMEINTKQSDIVAKLGELQGTKIASFPQKFQKYGTCSYVNKVAATEGLLCLLKLDKQNQLSDAAIKTYAADNRNRISYKAFTNACRDLEVDRIIHLIEQAKGNGNKQQLGVMVNIAFSIAAKYHEQKNDDPQKIQAQDERANRLMQAILPHQNLLTTDNKKNYESVKTSFENRVLARQPLHLNQTPLSEEFKEQISNKIGASFSIIDRMPPWFMEASAKVQKAKTLDEVAEVFDVLVKKFNSDSVLAQLNVDVRAMLRAQVPQPEPRVSQVVPIVNAKTPILDKVQETPPDLVNPALNQLRKDIFGLLPVFSHTQRVEMPKWYIQLSLKVDSAKSATDIAAAFAGLKVHLQDNQFSKIMDKSFEVLISRAKDLNEIINIVEKYPKDKIVSPSGSQYDRQALIEQLKQSPLPLQGVTSAMGIRKRVGELQGQKVDVAPIRKQIAPMLDKQINFDKIKEGAGLKKKIIIDIDIEKMMKGPPKKNR